METDMRYIKTEAVIDPKRGTVAARAKKLAKVAREKTLNFFFGVTIALAVPVMLGGLYLQTTGQGQSQGKAKVAAGTKVYVDDIKAAFKNPKSRDAKLVGGMGLTFLAGGLVVAFGMRTRRQHPTEFTNDIFASGKDRQGLEIVSYKKKPV